MEWYDRIRTTGDPDVHFAGFDMERTQTGKPKAKRVQIKAESYGQELVSAVSCLSESKLNALGLCMSIARNLKAQSPFSFLIIDDPIQSWDAEHETQFIELLQLLINRGKQILLMSHNKRWIEMVRAGCRSMSGRYYEFTGYTKEGPIISEMEWIPWRNRLDDIDATIKDARATAIKLQHAEEDIRIVCSEIACEIYYRKTGEKKSAHDLNSRKARKMLLASGIDSGLVDRITMTYETTDDAHHAPVDYEAVRQRIKKYHSWAHELAREISIV